MTDAAATRPRSLADALAALERAEERIRALEEAMAASQVRQLRDYAFASETRFRLLAEGVPNHLLFFDRDLRIEFANDVFLEASGWSAETAQGRHICEVVGPDGISSAANTTSGRSPARA